LKEPISPLKFKTANGRHIENRFGDLKKNPAAIWASTIDGFRIVSDTLVNTLNKR